MFQFDDNRIEKFEDVLVLEGRVYTHFLLYILSVFVTSGFGEKNEFACSNSVFGNIDSTKNTIKN